MKLDAPTAHHENRQKLPRMKFLRIISGCPEGARKWRNQIASALLAVGFLLGIQEGRLALWVADDPEPVRIFPRQVSSLPPADQLMLRRGIVIQEQTELVGLLEDYL